MQPARILFLALDMSPFGGLQIYCRNLVSTLRLLGQQVDVWSIMESKPTVEKPIGAYRCLAPTNQFWYRVYYHLWSPLLTARLAAISGEYDLVIAGHLYLLPAIYQASRFRPLRYSVCTFGIEAWADWHPTTRAGLAGCDWVLSLSNYTAGSILQRLPEANVVVVPPSVDTHLFRPKVAARDVRDAKVLLTVGRLAARERYKGHDVVISALPEVSRHVGIPLEYWIVGDGDDRPRLQRLAREKRVGNAVKFLGAVWGDDLIDIYDACDIFVMPSKVEKRPNGSWTGEGFGIVYLEASACGKPVIGSNEGGAAEAVVDGITGFTVDPNLVNAVSDALVRLLADGDLVRRMGEAGRRHVVDNFSVAAFQRRIAKLLTDAGLAISETQVG